MHDKTNTPSPSLPNEGTTEDTFRVDLNCDMGEGMDNDALIMPFISSANIACGYHAGDAQTMRETIELAKAHKVAIGAHISFADRENFGRAEMRLPANAIYELVQQQLLAFKNVAGPLGLHMNHVKPHGALYNMSAKDAAIAKIIAQAVWDFDRGVILFGLSGSHSVHEAKLAGLKTASEVFADRTYQPDGSLTPRSQPHALIDDTGEAMRQVLQMIKEGTVTSVNGKIIPITVETVCIHGDSRHAVEYAQHLSLLMQKEGIKICPPAR